MIPRRCGSHRLVVAVFGLFAVAFAGASLSGCGGSTRRQDARRARVTKTTILASVVGSRPESLGRHAVVGSEIAAVRRLASHGLPLYCGGTQKPLVALTFDDGPGIYTHYAIEKLKAAHLHATFFLVGKEINAWPGLAPREKPVAAFGDHTMTHPYLPGLPYAEAVDQIVAARRLIERTVHQPVLLFRPPYGSHTPAIDAEIRRLRMVETLWDVDSQDSLGANYLGIEHDVIAGLRPGSIVLMHENRGQTIRALDVIFAALKQRHLEAVTVPQLISEDPPSLAQLREGYDGCPVRLRKGSGG